MGEVVIEFPNDGKQYSIDATETIAPTYTQAVSENFVEDGANISDHTRPKPLTISLTGFIGDAPEIAPTTFDANGIPQASSGPRYYDPEAEGQHTEFHQRMQIAATTGEQINIDCGSIKGLYERMVITSYAPSWNSGTGNSLNFTLTCQQILTATTEKTKIPIVNKFKPDGLKPAAKKGLIGASLLVDTKSEKLLQPVNLGKAATATDTRRFADPLSLGNQAIQSADTNLVKADAAALSYQGQSIDTIALPAVN
jgi:hypothetical protein